jgi:hypothetical protein
MFAWLYDVITSLFFLVLSFFGIKWGQSQESSGLLNQEQSEAKPEPNELVVETITEEQAL